VANRLIIEEGGCIHVNGKEYRGGIGSSYSTDGKAQQGESISGVGGMLHFPNIGGGGGGGMSRKRKRGYYESITYFAGAGGGYGSPGLAPPPLDTSLKEEGEGGP